MITRTIIAERLSCTYRVDGRACKRRARAWVRFRLPFFSVGQSTVYQEAPLCPEHERALAEQTLKAGHDLVQKIVSEPCSGVRRAE